MFGPSMHNDSWSVYVVVLCKLSHNRHYVIFLLNTLKPRQNVWYFPDDIFKHTFLNENVQISNTIWLNFVPKGANDKDTALVQIMAWRRPGDKPLSEPMMSQSWWRTYASLVLNEVTSGCRTNLQNLGGCVKLCFNTQMPWVTRSRWMND